MRHFNAKTSARIHSHHKANSISLETLNALWLSIEHWHTDIWPDPYRALRLNLHQSEHCALCHIYISNQCLGCPVQRRSNKAYCQNTPWAELRTAYVKHYYECNTVSKKYLQPIVEAEIAFLVSLLPEPLK